MPDSLSELLSLFALTPQADGTLLAPAPRASVLAKTYGGQYLAQAVVAAEQQLGDPGRVPHAVFGTFLSAGIATEAAEVTVDSLRDGRSFSTRRVGIHQGTRPLFDGTVSFHVPEEGYRHQIGLPDVAPPERCPRLSEAIAWTGAGRTEMWDTEWRPIEYRYAGGALRPDATLRTEVPTTQRIWMRVREPLPDDPALHRILIAYLSDVCLISSALIPHGVFITTEGAPRATLNHALWLYEAARADEWLLFDQGSTWAGGGRGHATSQVFTLDGRLVASTAQEGLIRPPLDTMI